MLCDALARIPGEANGDAGLHECEELTLAQYDIVLTKNDVFDATS
jgi:hypothetical protein